MKTVNGIDHVIVRTIGRIRGRRKAHTAGDLAAGFIMSHIDRGRNFEPLSPATRAYRGSGEPLKVTGGLLRSIQSAVQSDDQVLVFSDARYARLQDQGGTITARKEWLYIPTAETRRLQHTYGYSPKAVLDGLRSAGFWVYRTGRQIRYRRKGKHKAKIAYYLKKSVVIPSRRFFFLSDDELEMICREIGNDIVSGS